MKTTVLFWVILLILTESVRAQTCTAIGQNPSTAFPVCGIQTFQQQSVPICGVRNIPGPSCNNPGNGPHMDKNPFWYKFTCYTPGTLGFTITPNILSEDYDWQIFDITGHQPDDVYTDPSLYLTMNWSGETGTTGASSAGTSLDVCGGFNLPTFSAMATLKQGHNYLLLISHFSDSQSGYSLTFGGGTASITDPTLPQFKNAFYYCAPVTIGIKLNKNVKCNSLAADGSDFAFSIAGPKILSAKGVNCNNGFDMDSLVLQVDKPLAPGTYTIVSKTGTDGNTLLDACGNAMQVNQQISFTVASTPPVAMGSVAPFTCGPNELQLTFPQAIRCSSVSPDGGDFVISGPAPVKITSAVATCNADDTTSFVTLKLDRRITAGGNYTITLVTGPDGNTVESECHVQTPPGAQTNFHIDQQPDVLLRGASAVTCRLSGIRIGISQPVRCASIAADGSDFIFTSAKPVTITSAKGVCNSNGLADSIDLQFSGPVYHGEDYTIQLVNGTDGNTLQGACWQLAAAGQQVAFRTADTVSAVFSTSLEQHCKVSTLQLSHDGAHAVNSWNWVFDDGSNYTDQNPVKVYTSLGTKSITLTVSNGICSAVHDTSFVLTSEVTAAFDVDPGPYCPMDIVSPKNKSTGNITSWFWDYGNGMLSGGPTPTQLQYYPTRKEENYRIRLIVENNVHCMDTADHYITAVTSCYIDVPTAFSPNNDGQNDYLYPLNAYKALDLHFSIYNRYGQLLFETTDWRRKWDGTVNGRASDVGTYVWMLQYTEKETGKKVFRKGTTVLIR